MTGDSGDLPGHWRPDLAFLQLVLLQMVTLVVWKVDSSGWVSGACLMLLPLVCFRILRDGKDLGSQAILVFLLSLGSIRLSVPLKDLEWVRAYQAIHLFMGTDRISAGLLVQAFTFIWLTSRWVVQLRTSWTDLCWFFGSLGLLAFKGFANAGDFPRWSLYQYAVDAPILLGTVAFFLLVRSRTVKLDQRDLKRGLDLLVLLALVDCLGSLFKVTSWARSYRNAFAGVLSGSEVYAAVFYGAAFLVVWFSWRHRRALRLWVCLLLLGSLAMTENKTGLIAVLMVALLCSRPLSRLIRRLRPIGIAILGVMVAGGITLWWQRLPTLGDSSTAARVGTVVAAVPSFMESPVVGAGSGIFECMHITNMGTALFDFGYSEWMGGLNLPTQVTEEMLMRSSLVDEGGEFSPHLTPALLVLSYGVPFIPVVLVLYLVWPFRILRRWRHFAAPHVQYIGMYFAFVIFSLMHPRPYLYELVFLALCLGILGKGLHLGGEEAPTGSMDPALRGMDP